MNLACFLLLCNIGLTLGAPGITDMEKDTHQEELDQEVLMQEKEKAVEKSGKSEITHQVEFHNVDTITREEETDGITPAQVMEDKDSSDSDDGIIYEAGTNASIEDMVSEMELEKWDKNP